MSKNAAITQLIVTAETLVRGLCDYEDQVAVTVTPEEYHTNVIVDVDPRDFGKVIGSNGYLIRASRQLLRAVGYKLKLPPVSMIVRDPKPGRLRTDLQ